VAVKFIGILDAFDRFSEAAAAVTADPNVKKWIDGFEGIAFMFRESLRGYGVLPMSLVGKPFDPYLCLAVGTVEDSARTDGVIVAEKRKGYHYKGRLLRPAEVIVVRNRPN
ncbi:MAG: nucleotide exchange factor GrpE, partial [bacterium]